MCGPHQPPASPHAEALGWRRKPFPVFSDTTAGKGSFSTGVMEPEGVYFALN